MKRICSIMTIGAMLAACGGAMPGSAAEQGVPEAQIVMRSGHPCGLSNGAKFQIDPDNAEAAPYYEGDTMMAPLRFIAERLGGEVSYDAAMERAEILSSPAVRLVAGESRIWVNGKAQPVDRPIAERGGRIYVPLRAVSQALGKTVVWFSNDVVVSGTGTQDALRRTAEAEMETLLTRLGAESGAPGTLDPDFQAIKKKLKESV